MVTILKKNNNNAYYCANCRMIPTMDTQLCPFCGAIFSNYEEVQKELWDEIFNEILNDTINSYIPDDKNEEYYL